MRQHAEARRGQTLAQRRQVFVGASHVRIDPVRDPADQIIVATSRVLGVLLVTLDKRIRAYTHVRTASAGAA